MKKITILLVALLLSTVFISCNDSGVVSSDNSVDSVVSTDNAKGNSDDVNVIYKVVSVDSVELFADGSNISYTDSGNSTTIMLKDSKQEGVGYFTGISVKESSLLQSKELTINGSKLKYNYIRSDIPEDKYAEVCPKNGDYYADRYMASTEDDTLCTVNFLHGTDTIVSYYNGVGAWDGLDVIANLSDEAIFQIAEDFLLQIFSKEELSEYSRIRIRRESEDEKYWVVFERQIFGYGTEDRITVVVHPSGKVISVTAPNRGRYSNSVLPNGFTKEHINEINEGALQRIGMLDGFRLTDSTPEIVMNGKNEMFLEYTIEPDSEGAPLESLYVKLTNRLEQLTTK